MKKILLGLILLLVGNVSLAGLIGSDGNCSTGTDCGKWCYNADEGKDSSGNTICGCEPCAPPVPAKAIPINGGSGTTSIGKPGQSKLPGSH